MVFPLAAGTGHGHDVHHRRVHDQWRARRRDHHSGIAGRGRARVALLRQEYGSFGWRVVCEGARQTESDLSADRVGDFDPDRDRHVFARALLELLLAMGELARGAAEVLTESAPRSGGQRDLSRKPRPPPLAVPIRGEMPCTAKTQSKFTRSARGCCWSRVLSSGITPRPIGRAISAISAIWWRKSSERRAPSKSPEACGRSGRQNSAALTVARPAIRASSGKDWRTRPIRSNRTRRR